MLKLRGASTSERGRGLRILKNINYDFSMTHAPTPWGFSPLIGGTNFKHEYVLMIDLVLDPKRRLKNENCGDSEL